MAIKHASVAQPDLPISRSRTVPLDPVDQLVAAIWNPERQRRLDHECVVMSNLIFMMRKNHWEVPILPNTILYVPVATVLLTLYPNRNLGIEGNLRLKHSL
jgi:hypothetical protein